jgi:hypothetical protein
MSVVEDEVEIQRVCRECSEEVNPPDVFLVTSESMGGALLGVSVMFLERGQFLPWPGLPLVGATFDPDWGFARAVTCLDRDGAGDFQLLPTPFDSEGDRNSYGYRLCPIENREIPLAIRQLEHIRAELAKPKRRSRKRPGANLTAIQL